jgi:hypothetical protein
MTRIHWIVAVVAAAIGGAGIGAIATHSALAADSSNLPWQTDVSGGAPEKVLVDNDALRVTLISYPEGFHRQGDQRRPYNTLIAYIDEGSFKVTPRAGARPRTGESPNASRLGKPAQCDPNPAKDCGAVGPDGAYSGQPYAPGTVNYHPKGNVTPTISVTKAYRALYIELKK